MGYFSNGTEGMIYEEEYCDKCVHNHEEHGCPCLDAHMLWNYDECNNKDSILHKMIPREGIENKECIFFVEGIDPWIPVSEQEPPKDGKQYLWRRLQRESVFVIWWNVECNEFQEIMSGHYFTKEVITIGEWTPIPGGEK